LEFRHLHHRVERERHHSAKPIDRRNQQVERKTAVVAHDRQQCTKRWRTLRFRSAVDRTNAREDQARNNAKDCCQRKEGRMSRLIKRPTRNRRCDQHHDCDADPHG